MHGQIAVYAYRVKFGEFGGQPVDVVNESRPDDDLGSRGELLAHVEEQRKFRGVMLVAPIDECRVRGALGLGVGVA